MTGTPPATSPYAAWPLGTERPTCLFWTCPVCGNPDCQDPHRGYCLCPSRLAAGADVITPHGPGRAVFRLERPARGWAVWQVGVSRPQLDLVPEVPPLFTAIVPADAWVRKYPQPQRAYVGYLATAVHLAGCWQVADVDSRLSATNATHHAGPCDASAAARADASEGSGS